MVSKWRVTPVWRNGRNEGGLEEKQLSVQGYGSELAFCLKRLEADNRLVVPIQGDEAINTAL